MNYTLSVKWIALISLLLAGCNSEPQLINQKFDEAKWGSKVEDNYTYRKLMIKDLLDNYKWAGQTKDYVIKLLGEPDLIEEDIFLLYHYDRSQLGPIIVSTSSLVIELETDRMVKLARRN